jgi:RIO kinase 1
LGSSDSGELQRLLDDGVVEEIVGRLKTGKEAEVWLVSHAGEIVAAKVYKDSAHRSFQNRAGYQEGRQVRNSRTRRAMEKGSKFGRAAEEDAWKSTEADALYKLHALGVRVPKPVMFYEGVLLMEAVIDPEGHPAPRLMDAPLPPEQALALYKDLRSQVIRMLAADLIHGDLSPYNVLLAWNGPTVIDFPQVVSAAGNSRAEMYFKRDLDNLRQFFGGLDRAVMQLSGDSHEIWRAYTRRELTPDFEPTGKPPPPEPQRQGAHPNAPAAGGPLSGQRREYRPGDDPRNRRPGPPRGDHPRPGSPGGPRGPGHDAHGPSGAPGDHRGGPRGPRHNANGPSGAPGEHRGGSRGPRHDAHGPSGAPGEHRGGPRGPRHDAHGPSGAPGDHRGGPRGPRHDSHGPSGAPGEHRAGAPGHRQPQRGNPGASGEHRGGPHGPRHNGSGRQGPPNRPRSPHGRGSSGPGNGTP